jgi:hypothetical protein
MHPTRSLLLGWSTHQLTSFDCWSIIRMTSLLTTQLTDVDIWSIGRSIVSICRSITRPTNSTRCVVNHQNLMFQHPHVWCTTILFFCSRQEYYLLFLVQPNQQSIFEEKHIARSGLPIIIVASPFKVGEANQ